MVFIVLKVLFSSHQQKDFSLEESESSGDEKQEVTSNFREESKITNDLFQTTQKPSRHLEMTIKRWVKKGWWWWTITKLMEVLEANYIHCFLLNRKMKHFSPVIQLSSFLLFFRECPTSTSTEEEAIQGMLSMAGLHYTTCLPSHMQSTDCTDRRSSLQEHRSYPKSRHKDKLSSQSHKAEYGMFSCRCILCQN